MITAIGGYTIQTITSTSALLLLFLETLFLLFRQLFVFRFRWRETLDQMYSIAIQSLPVIVLSLTFISVMLITEFSFHVKLVLRQNSLVPAFSTILMIRELGPVVTCLLLASRVGAGIAAEIGSMKVTEQLDALRLLSIDPVEYLTLPRWVACVFAAVALSITAVAIGVVGGAIIASVTLGYTLEEYFNTMFVFTRYSDLVGCAIKAAVFGSIIPITASHQGFRCQLGSEGVGNAATAAVVHSSLLIIVADFILTYLIYAL